MTSRISYDFSGTVVLVTGGSGGIGSTIAGAFARSGAHVIIHYCRSTEKAKALLADLHNQGLSAELIRANIADHDAVRQMMSTVADTHGRLDALINNAASGAFVDLAHLRDKDLTRAIDVDIKGTLWCSQEALPLLRSAHGSIVNLSMAGVVYPFVSGLGPVKAAVDTLTRYLAVEYGPLGVRANTVAPGLITGDRSRTFPRYRDMVSAVQAATPLAGSHDGHGTPRDISDAVLFLTSAEARWITGQKITVDGGLSTTGLTMPPISHLAGEATP
jgi:enoyl-[acyl-carrier protein] reductase III